MYIAVVKCDNVDDCVKFTYDYTIVVQLSAQASLMTATRGHQLLSSTAITWTYRMDGMEDDEPSIIGSHEQPSVQSVVSGTAVIVTRGYSFNRTGGQRLAPSSRAWSEHTPVLVM